MNSKIEFSVYINLNLHQEKLGTERTNYFQTNRGSATYLLYKSQKIILIINYKIKIMINKKQLHTK